MFQFLSANRDVCMCKTVYVGCCQGGVLWWDTATLWSSFISTDSQDHWARW